MNAAVSAPMASTVTPIGEDSSVIALTTPVMPMMAGPSEAAKAAIAMPIRLVLSSSSVNFCARFVNAPSALLANGSSCSPSEAAASLALSSAVLNLPDTVWLSRSIAPSAKPPVLANDCSTWLNCSTLTAPAPSLSAGRPVASLSAVKIGMPRSASWFRFSSSTLPFALTLAKMAAISSMLLPLVAAMSPRNCSWVLTSAMSVPLAISCRADLATASS